MSSNITISVVIPTCNRPGALAECLHSLASQVRDDGPLPPGCYEIIVADDSKEESAKNALADRFPKVLFIAGPKQGPAANRNAGSRKASGEMLIFIDDDCICSSRLVGSYLEAASNNPDVNVFEGRTVAMGSPKSHADCCPVNESGGCLWSCNFGIKKSLFDLVAGFDETFPYPAGEDEDLRYRLTNLDQTILFLPNALVSHPWVCRLGWEGIRRHRLSQLIYLKKHPSELQKLPALKMLAWLTKHLLQETVRGLPYYGLKHISQRLRNLLGAVYFLSTLSALRNEVSQRKARFIPESWRLQD